MQKTKMLQLVELLKRETDTNHPMKTEDICSKIRALNIRCDRRTIPGDIDELNALGFNIIRTKIGHSHAYYMNETEFQYAEIKILIDAVQASKVIPEEQTELLIDKLVQLSGTIHASALKDNTVRFNIRKQTNADIFSNIEVIETALRHQYKVSFLYFKHDENCDRIYSHDGELYVADPISLIYTDENYYLRCFNAAHGGMRNYRIDRMEKVSLIEELICDEALVKARDLEKYTSETFKMYGGDSADVVLEFDNSLIDVIYDQFGMNVKIMRINENKLIAHVNIQVSRIFWGWYFQFPDKMRILSPDSLVQECEEWRNKRYMESRS